MLFGNLYIYYVKVHKGEGEVVWHAVLKLIYLLCERHRGEGEAMRHAVLKVIYLLCESTNR